MWNLHIQQFHIISIHSESWCGHLVDPSLTPTFPFVLILDSDSSGKRLKPPLSPQWLNASSHVHKLTAHHQVNTKVETKLSRTNNDTAWWLSDEKHTKHSSSRAGRAIMMRIFFTSSLMKFTSSLSDLSVDYSRTETTSELKSKIRRACKGLIQKQRMNTPPGRASPACQWARRSSWRWWVRGGSSPGSHGPIQLSGDGQSRERHLPKGGRSLGSCCG